MKSVLISIRPEWVYEILNERKTIEIRKTIPKIATPFRCYIYCTLGKEPVAYSDFCGYDMTDFREDFLVNGMVCAEFICDRIIPIKVFNNGTIQDWNWYELEKSCVPYDDVVKYIGNNRDGYGWRISELKIYDKPKYIGDFKVRVTNDVWSFTKKLERPPKNWCYVEE